MSSGRIFDLSPPKSVLHDSEVESFNYHKFYDPNSGNPAGQTKFVFRINDINSLWLLSRSYIHMSWIVTIPAGERGTVTNDIRNFFNRVILRLNDTVIEDKSNYFYRECYPDRLRWSKQYAEQMGDLMWYKPEDASNYGFSYFEHSVPGISAAGAAKILAGAGGNMLDTDFANLDQFNDTKCAAGYHAQVTQTGEQNHALVPLLHLVNFPKVWQKVIRGFDIELELHCTPDPIRLFQSGLKVDGTVSTAAISADWAGRGITLWCPRVTGHPEIAAKLNNQLASGVNIPVMYPKTHVNRQTLANADGTSGQWRIVNTASRPVRVEVFLTQQTTETNLQTPLDNFATPIFSKLNLSVNGHRLPAEDVIVDNVTAGNAWRQADLTQILRQHQTDMGNLDSVYDRNFGLMGGNINNHTFAHNPVYTYDLTKKEVADWVGSASELVLDWGLAAAVGANYWIYAIIMTESQVNLNMSAHRAVAEVIIP